MSRTARHHRPQVPLAVSFPATAAWGREAQFLAPLRGPAEVFRGRGKLRPATAGACSHHRPQWHLLAVYGPRAGGARSSEERRPDWSMKSGVGGAGLAPWIDSGAPATPRGLNRASSSRRGDRDDRGTRREGASRWTARSAGSGDGCHCAGGASGSDVIRLVVDDAVARDFGRGLPVSWSAHRLGSAHHSAAPEPASSGARRERSQLLGPEPSARASISLRQWRCRPATPQDAPRFGWRGCC